MLQFPLIDRSGDLELTPLHTTCEYAGPVSSYMPIATVRFAFSPDEGVIFLLNSFDTVPYVEEGSEEMENDAVLCGAFDFFPGTGGAVLRFVLNAEGRCRFYRDAELLRETLVPVLRGEEERGIFWGARISFCRQLLKETYGRDEILPGQTVEGNVFKRKASRPGRHFGAIAPLEPGKGLFDRENLRPFEAVQM